MIWVTDSDCIWVVTLFLTISKDLVGAAAQRYGTNGVDTYTILYSENHPQFQSFKSPARYAHEGKTRSQCSVDFVHISAKKPVNFQYPVSSGFWLATWIFDIVICKLRCSAHVWDAGRLDLWPYLIHSACAWNMLLLKHVETCWNMLKPVETCWNQKNRLGWSDVVKMWRWDDVVQQLACKFFFFNLGMLPLMPSDTWTDSPKNCTPINTELMMIV